MAAAYTPVIGLMSGTSVDGLDIAYCRFKPNNAYELVAAKTYAYPAELAKALQGNLNLTANELFALDAELGYFFGKAVKRFLAETKLPAPKAIASHGHTVFHNPAQNYTVQIGKGSHIAAVTGIPVVCDFRSTDVAHGGQGAPLVPIGDALLFGQYDYCLNLGGFANVSYQKGAKRLAFDIGPCNLPANMLVQKTGKTYDHNGDMGKSGHIMEGLLADLNKLAYYSQKPPKSLGREWVEQELMPWLNTNEKPEDVLRTYYEHVAMQVAAAITKKGASVLVTGGGAHNTFLMRLIHQKTHAVLVTPQPQLIDFKEALVFAFLGYRRIYHKPNGLKSVTGAAKDSVGGCIYL